jgi:hypothetical protein
MGKKKNVYAVVRGHAPGIYHSWDECARQVNGFQGNLYKGFNDEVSALRFLDDNGLGLAGAPRKAPAAAEVEVAAIVQAMVQGGTECAAELCSQTCGAAVSEAPRTSAAPPALPAGAGIGRRLQLEFDGASRRNPGPAGLGAALFDIDTGEEVATLAHYLGDRMTNNQAEYAALIAGMKVNTSGTFPGIPCAAYSTSPPCCPRLRHC